MTTQEFIERANKVHKDKYDYSFVELLRTKDKIRIICPEHGEFRQLPYNHLKGSGCPICAKEKQGKWNLKPKMSF